MKSLAVLLALAVSLTAQDAQFNAQSRVVLVPVTVTGSGGRLVEDLQPSDFVLLDDGARRPIAVDTLATGLAPIALVLAVQSSGISIPVLEKVRKIGAMIHPLVTGEPGCAAVVSFSERVDWLQDCTKDAGAFTRAIDRIQPGAEKHARMLDALYQSIERLRAYPNARRVILLISESRDRDSEIDLGTVVTAAQTAGVTIYAATYSAVKAAFNSKAPVAHPETPKVLLPSDVHHTRDGSAPSYRYPPTPPPEQRIDLKAAIGELARLHKTNTTRVLTGITGGETLPFARQKQLEAVIIRLGRELHTQYVLSFTPEESAAPGYHHLEVRITRPGDFDVRARPGYWFQTSRTDTHP